MSSIEMLENPNDIEFDVFQRLQEEEQQRRMRRAMRLHANAFARRHWSQSAVMPQTIGQVLLLASATLLHWAVSTSSRILAWTTAHRLLSRGT